MLKIIFCTDKESKIFRKEEKLFLLSPSALCHLIIYTSRSNTQSFLKSNLTVESVLIYQDDIISHTRKQSNPFSSGVNGDPSLKLKDNYKECASGDKVVLTIPDY